MVATLYIMVFLPNSVRGWGGYELLCTSEWMPRIAHLKDGRLSRRLRSSKRLLWWLLLHWGHGRGGRQQGRPEGGLLQRGGGQRARLQDHCRVCLRGLRGVQRLLRPQLARKACSVAHGGRIAAGRVHELLGDRRTREVFRFVHDFYLLLGNPGSAEVGHWERGAERLRSGRRRIGVEHTLLRNWGKLLVRLTCPRP